MLEISRLTFQYRSQKVLKNLDISLRAGRIGCILGPSGCGKTTLLRCIAGFERVTGGEIRAGKRMFAAPNVHLPAEQRRVGMVFQDYALLPHLTVMENVAFGLHELPADSALDRATDMLQHVGLDQLADRLPHEISGGQQQRVAVARALAPEPELLLMDEPFSNLDAGMRSSLGQSIKRLLKSLGTTALVATHDHHDAFAIADDIGVMRDGELLQWDRAYEVYHRPSDRFVADFVGRGAWLPGLVLSGNTVEIEPGRTRGHLTQELQPGTRVDLLLRPDDVVHDDDSDLQAVVVDKRFRGSNFLYKLELPSGATLWSAVPSHHDHAVGESIGIRLDTEHMVAFPRET